MLRNGPDRTDSSMGFGSAPSRTIFESLTAFWIIVVNLLYYAQFKTLIISRFGFFLHRWH